MSISKKVVTRFLAKKFELVLNLSLQDFVIDHKIVENALCLLLGPRLHVQKRKTCDLSVGKVQNKKIVKKPTNLKLTCRRQTYCFNNPIEIAGNILEFFSHQPHWLQLGCLINRTQLMLVV
jgi:hypothetical protein